YLDVHLVAAILVKFLASWWLCLHAGKLESNHYVCHLQARVVDIVEHRGSMICRLHYPVERVAKYDVSHVTNVQRLGWVDAGVLDYDVASLARVVVAITIRVFQHLCKCGCRQFSVICPEVDVAGRVRLGRKHERVLLWLYALDKLAGYFLRRLFGLLAHLERDVAGEVAKLFSRRL